MSKAPNESAEGEILRRLARTLVGGCDATQAAAHSPWLVEQGMVVYDEDGTGSWTDVARRACGKRQDDAKWLDELHQEARRLDGLLSDRQIGLSSWWAMLGMSVARMEELARR